MSNINSIIKPFSLLSINVDDIIKIQKWYRGCILRLKRLPLIMYYIQKYLKSKNINFCYNNKDGRINSSIDEDMITKLLQQKFTDRIKITKIRMWYDILAYDYIYGWIPINIKITTAKTADNSGNLTMCVYSYTNNNLDLNKIYQNGQMSIILFDKLKNKEFNYNNKKDYYFIVINKNTLIINSLKGLANLTPNINNLPFQICWDKNREYKYDHVNKKIQLFINCLQTPKPSWKEIFMNNIRTLSL